MIWSANYILHTVPKNGTFIGQVCLATQLAGLKNHLNRRNSFLKENYHLKTIHVRGILKATNFPRIYYKTHRLLL